MENQTQAQEPPIGKDGQRMKKFEIRRRAVMGFIDRAIFIDGEKFDWEVDKASLQEAIRMGPEFFKAAQRDIQKHFLESLSDFLHRKVTEQEVAEATRTGWI